MSEHPLLEYPLSQYLCRNTLLEYLLSEYSCRNTFVRILLSEYLCQNTVVRIPLLRETQLLENVMKDFVKHVNIFLTFDD